MDMDFEAAASSETTSSESVTPKVPAHSLTISRYVTISIFWFGVSLHWAAFLTIVMQERVASMVSPFQKGTYFFVLTALGATISTVIELVAGPISDRCDSPLGRRRPFILWGTLFSLPFIMLFMWTDRFWLLVFYFVMIQLFLNWANGPYQAVIPDQVPPERHGLASAYMGLMTLLGTAIGLAAAGLIVGEHPLLLGQYSESTRLTLVGVILCGSLFVTMLWTVIGMKEKRWIPSTPEAKRITLRHVFYIPLREHRNFVYVILSRFCINIAFSTVTFFLDYYLRDSIGLGDKSPQFVFIVIELALVSGLLGNAIAGKITDYYSKKTVMYVCCAVLGGSTFFFLFTHSLISVYILGAIFGIAWGAFTAVDWALASNLVPPEEAGRYMAIWHIASTVPQVIAPAVGPLADLFNRYEMGLGWRIVFLSIPLYLLIGVLFLRPVKEREIGR